MKNECWGIVIWPFGNKKVTVPAKVPVIGTFTGTFTNFGISVVPVTDGQNSSFFWYFASVLPQPQYRCRYQYWQYRLFWVPDTGF
jgi:hypothetical protein